MALNAGQIAFVAYNADGTDSFSFVVLGTIAAGEVVNFTDNGWTSAGAFRPNEGTIAWTAPAGGIAAGTVVTLTATTASTGDLATITSGFDFTAAGDGVIAYQGTAGAPTMIAALNNEGTTWQANATNSSTSALPTGLVDGETAIAITEIDNVAYNGPTTGNLAFLQAELYKQSNWGLRSDTLQQSGPPAFNILDVPTAFADNFLGTSGADTFDMLAGNDYFDGGQGNDTITGGTGVDRLFGGEGDDVFVVRAGDTASGEVYDGGDGADSIQVVGGGTVSLVGPTLSDIETIELMDVAGTRLVVSDAATAALVRGSNSDADVLQVNANLSVDFALMRTALEDNGIEAVVWTDAHNNQRTATLENGVLQTEVVNMGTGGAWDTVTRTFHADNALATVSTEYKNGTVGTATYDVDGVSMLSRSVADVGGNMNYDTIDTTFFNGVMSTRFTEYDTHASIDYMVETFDAAGGLDVKTLASLDGSLNVTGGTGDNIISGGAMNDTFRGGAGSDVFEFIGPTGNDRISDFTNGFDTLDFKDYGITDMASLGSAASQVGRNVVIDLGANGSVTLLNFQMTNLDDSDFFVA